MSVKLYCGNCLTVLPTLADGCIDLTVTSPPYDNLRKYKGYTFDFEPIARELYRVTKPGGVVVWVVGDETRDGCESLTSFKQSIYFVEGCGFNLHDTMIYRTDKPPMNDRRYQAEFEFMFVFSKGRPNTFNPIKVRTIGQGKSPRATFRNTDGSLKSAYHNKPTGETKVKGSIWYYPTGGVDIGHPAPFPKNLARDHIFSWSNPGDTILDPMMGSGTSGEQSVILGRSFVGMEISSEYFAIAEKRIAQAEAQPALLQV